MAPVSSQKWEICYIKCLHLSFKHQQFFSTFRKKISSIIIANEKICFTLYNLNLSMIINNKTSKTFIHIRKIRILFVFFNVYPTWTSIPKNIFSFKLKNKQSCQMDFHTFLSNLVNNLVKCVYVYPTSFFYLIKNLKFI
jgi:hypothetical protein